MNKTEFYKELGKLPEEEKQELIFDALCMKIEVDMTKDELVKLLD